jgi:outer membrane receptor protein involved in Fe transport
MQSFAFEHTFTASNKETRVMPTLRFNPTPLTLAVALSLAAFGAHAQQTPANTDPGKAEDSKEKSDDGLKMDRIVVTGTSTARTKMKQSVSVSTLDSDQIQNSGAQSSAELLRNIPGLRSESSGGEGNANMTVRGAPISAGGSRYLQLQEDGLPLILVGDISFGTADQFLRADGMVDSVQVIRGGSASTLATNSPAGIVNFLSKTGRQTGGSVGLSLGGDHSQTRADFDYGAKLGPSTRFQMGGYFRVGEGTRNTDVNVENGGQFRANITHEFKGGYVRAYLKLLSDKTPTYLPVPVKLNGNRIEQIPGIDPRSAFFINRNFSRDVTFNRDGQPTTSNPQDGLKINSSSIGLEGKFDLGSGFALEQRIRFSENSGRFIGTFPAGSQPPAQAAVNPKFFSMHLFNTELDDFGNTLSETRVSKAFDLGGGAKLTTLGGLFWGSQNIAQTWYWNRYNVELTGNGARILNDLGQATQSPTGPATQTWGGCCVRSLDVTIKNTSPFAALTYESGALSIDGSLRRDSQHTKGWQQFDNTPGAGGAFTGWNVAGREGVNYKADATSYSLGANYELNRASAVFARFSKGSSWASPDRTIWDANVALGRQPYPVNELKQFELGYKVRAGAFSGFFTFFDAKTKEDGGFEVTTRQYLKDSYSSRGIEAEIAWRAGDFQLAGGATITNAKITTPGATRGNKPRRQANLIYQLAPTYQWGDLTLGASFVGTTKSFAQNDNDVVLPGYVIANAFANYAVNDRLTLGLTANNLFNKLAYTEAEGQNNLGDNPLFVARAMNGRSIKLSARYTF